MTLQINTINGWTLTGFQLGPPDIAATISSATSAWGWMNGLAGVQRIFAYFRNPVIERKIDSIFTIPELLPSIFAIVSLSQGVAYVRDEESQTGFGGEPRTQIFGLSICALDHLIDRSEEVIDLFMNWLAPALLSSISTEAGGVREALHAQLTDNYTIIVNEGATRGLNQRFSKAIESLSIPSNEANARSNWADDQLIQYGTALVLRVAACFKSVGYVIGPLQTWNGIGSQPKPYGGVVLVMGGSGPTDALLPSPASFHIFMKGSLVYHYRYKSMGALLCTSVPSDIRPEIFQTLFDSVSQKIDRALSLVWAYNIEKNELCVKPNWRTDTEPSGSISTRLASIHFQHCAEKLAPIYDDLANEATLEAVLKTSPFGGQVSPKRLSKDDVLFRAKTASIIFAIIGRLGGKDFYNLQHSTTLNLDSLELQNVAKMLDAWLDSTLSFSQAVRLIAIVHCGIHFDTCIRDSPQLIGWRSGIYTIMPSLFFERAPIQPAMGLCCKDEFYGNIPVDRDGQILDTVPPGIMIDEDVTNDLLQRSKIDSRIRIFFENLIQFYLDVSLYLSIERVCNNKDLSICLCGRIDGELIGIVSVSRVLRTIAQSWQVPTMCPSHVMSDRVLNVSPSLWAKSSKRCKPSGSPHHTYIPVRQDHCWALFLAGEQFDWVTISHGCFECAVEVFKERMAIGTERRVRVIGYECEARPGNTEEHVEQSSKRLQIGPSSGSANRGLP